jgi:1,4-dihydroxy-2-naphthoyl-CoA synthase
MDLGLARGALRGTERYTVWMQSRLDPVGRREEVPREMAGDDGASGAEDAVLYQATSTGVAVITFNRPERLNAWGPDIAAGFYAAVDRAEADPAVRVIVLTGRGRAASCCVLSGR